MSASFSTVTKLEFTAKILTNRPAITTKSIKRNCKARVREDIAECRLAVLFCIRHSSKPLDLRGSWDKKKTGQSRPELPWVSDVCLAQFPVSVVLQASAKRHKTSACSAGYHHYKPQILHVNGRTTKTSSWEPFHGSFSILKLLG